MNPDDLAFAKAYPGGPAIVRAAFLFAKQATVQIAQVPYRNLACACRSDSRDHAKIIFLIQLFDKTGSW